MGTHEAISDLLLTRSSIHLSKDVLFLKSKILQVVWLHGSGGASVLAEWWGSKQEEQVPYC